MPRKWFEKLVCVGVLLGWGAAYAGSYEDFFIAIQRDDRSAITALLKRGFDPNSRDAKGQVGLFLALQKESLAAAQALLESEALDVNALNAQGESALMMAALRGRLDWCERLLQRGARVDQPGWSPLHYAATGPEPKTVALLLSRGANRDAEAPNRNTPLMMAARYGAEASVDLLLAQGADLKRGNAAGQTAADFARLGGREALSLRLAQLAR
jgi:uncharacterized protein